MPVRYIAILILFMVPAFAERTRTEVTKATTPEGDSKPNSDKVPEATAISAQFQRIVILRFKYQTDLLTAFEKQVAAQKIRNAVILSGVGSVRNYHLHSVSNNTFPSKNTYVKDTDAPADIISMNGYVIDGRIHCHMTMTDDNKAFGGHLEPGTNVFTFAILTLGVLDDSASLTGVDDKTIR